MNFKILWMIGIVFRERRHGMLEMHTHRLYNRNGLPCRMEVKLPIMGSGGEKNSWYDKR